MSGIEVWLTNPTSKNTVLDLVCASYYCCNSSHTVLSVCYSVCQLHVLLMKA